MKHRLDESKRVGARLTAGATNKKLQKTSRSLVQAGTGEREPGPRISCTSVHSCGCTCEGSQICLYRWMHRCVSMASCAGEVTGVCTCLCTCYRLTSCACNICVYIDMCVCVVIVEATFTCVCMHVFMVYVCFQVCADRRIHG